MLNLPEFRSCGSKITVVGGTSWNQGAIGEKVGGRVWSPEQIDRVRNSNSS